MTMPPRGWYTDPGNPEQLRWWDGDGWTQSTRERLPDPDAAPQMPASPQVPPLSYASRSSAHGMVGSTPLSVPSVGARQRRAPVSGVSITLLVLSWFLAVTMGVGLMGAWLFHADSESRLKHLTSQVTTLEQELAGIK